MPGDYTLSLYHRDILGDEDEDSGTDYALRVVVLTPQKDSSVEVTSPMLRFPTGASEI